MGKSYRPYYPDAELLLPPSLREWMPEDHLAYFVSDVVDRLDLSAMDRVYGDEKRGQPPCSGGDGKLVGRSDSCCTRARDRQCW